MLALAKRTGYAVGTGRTLTSRLLLCWDYPTSEGADIVNKTLNLILMVLMAALSVAEGYNIAQNGASARNVIFCMLFAAFAVRRFLIHQKLTA
jgi:hypothetical protein